MLVTQIRPVTRQKYRIEAEGLPPFVLYKGEVSRYHLEKDKELSMETYREILEEVLIKRAKLRTLHLLEQGDRTRKGLEERLLQNGYPPEAVEAALAYVGSFHYVDDKRYCGPRGFLRKILTMLFRRPRREQIPEKGSGS